MSIITAAPQAPFDELRMPAPLGDCDPARWPKGYDNSAQGSGGVVFGAVPHPLALLLPLALLVLMVGQSAFTVSDLFITHYALMLPLIPLAGGLAFAVLWARGREGRAAGALQDVRPAPPSSAPLHLRSLAAALALVALLLWAGGDLWTTTRYHRALAASGGHASHSDGIAALAGYLDRGGLSAPVALDWGIDASVRFLTSGRVNPTEVFGYERLDGPDTSFAGRLQGFLNDAGTVYVAHVPPQTVFRGRVEALAALAETRGLRLREEARFAERSGAPLFVVYRIVP